MTNSSRELIDFYNNEIIKIDYEIQSYLKRIGSTSAPIDVAGKYLVDKQNVLTTFAKKVAEIVSLHSLEIDNLKSRLEYLEKNRQSVQLDNKPIFSRRLKF